MRRRFVDYELLTNPGIRFGTNINTHQVRLNGQVVGVGRDHYKLLTMVRSIEGHNGDGKRVTTHELAMEGFDAFGTEATQFVPP